MAPVDRGDPPPDQALAGPAQPDRSLRFFGTIAVSIAIVAPTLAMSVTPSAVAGLMGSAVLLPFLFALVIIGLVAWGFMRLTARYSSAGSVYAFTGLTLGPRSGFFSGWALLGTYIGGVAASSAVAAVFGQDVIHQIDSGATISWIFIAAAVAIGSGLLALRPLKLVTTTLLCIECASVVLVLVLLVIVSVRVLGGFRPYGGVSAKDVVVPQGNLGISTIALASIFGFAAFLGFEGAGSVGEETREPRRTIPRAIMVVVIGAGIFFVACAVIESIGFGTSKNGLAAFSSSTSALADLGRTYAGRPLAIAIGLGATASGFSAALAQVAAASRLLFAMSRDGKTVPFLSRVSRGSAEPANAVLFTTGVALSLLLGFLIAGTAGRSVFLYIGSFQVIVVLVAYAMTNVGAGVLLFIREHVVRRVEVVFPLAAIACLIYTLYKQVVPAPPPPFDRIPYLALAWLVLGLLIVAASPSLARRIGSGLTESQEVQHQREADEVLEGSTLGVAAAGGPGRPVASPGDAPRVG